MNEGNNCIIIMSKIWKVYHNSTITFREQKLFEWLLLGILCFIQWLLLVCVIKYKIYNEFKD